MSNELTIQSPISPMSPNADIIFDVARFEHVWRVATAFSKSSLVPVNFQGKPENVFLAFHLAHRLGIDAIMAMNNVHVVHGNPGLSAQLCVALANKCGAFDTPITYEEIGAGDKLIVKASAKLKNGPIVSESVSLEQANIAGWTKMKDGGMKPFWKAKPGYMLQKRAATFLIRTYAPDVLLGFKTEEEWDDAGEGVQVQVKPSKAKSVADVLAGLPAPAKETRKAKTEPIVEEPKPEKNEENPDIMEAPTTDSQKENSDEDTNTLNF